MMRPIVSTIFTIMCHSNAPLQTKSDMETEDDEENGGDLDTENLFTCATQVKIFCLTYSINRFSCCHLYKSSFD